MGLFARKRDDETQPSHTPAEEAVNVSSAAAESSQDNKASSNPERDEDAPRRRHSDSESRFGIDEAMNLMRKLPDGDDELIARVVTQTLSSLNINVDRVIEDATDRVDETESTIESRRRQIIELEAEIAGHRSAIASLERELDEVSDLRTRLQRAVQPEQVATSSGKNKQAEQSHVEQGQANNRSTTQPSATANDSSHSASA